MPNSNQVLEMYKDFFEMQAIDYDEIKSMYDENFGNCSVLEHNSIKDYWKDVNPDSTETKAGFINRQSAISEAINMINYGMVKNPVILYENDSYYLMGINSSFLSIKPLSNNANKSFECSDIKCMVQKKEEFGLIEEVFNIKDKNISSSYYNSDVVDYLSGIIIFPTTFLVNEIDSNIVPDIQITYNNSELSKYEEGTLISTENMPKQEGKTIYRDFKDKLEKISYEKMISNKRTK